ncbi:MAG: DUF4399 domain-containing protein [bacterium]|nr:DUF4399 domain-containing protein [bacterium]
MNRTQFSKLSIGVFALSLLALTACGRGGEEAETAVFFKNLKNGDTVTSPVKVEMGVRGMEVKPAGEIVAGTGHHHILINMGAMSSGTVIPNDETHRHFGKGQTETELELEPGDYKLTLQFANGAHESYGEALSASINITVQ